MGLPTAMLDTELWSENHGKHETGDIVVMEHARARSICQQSGLCFPLLYLRGMANLDEGLQLSDIRDLTSKFWDFQFDCIYPQPCVLICSIANGR